MLCVTALEDRTTPTTVNATAISNAFESGDDGIIRISRDGSTSGSLDVQLSVGGTAVQDQDYTGELTTAIIPDGASYVDLTISALWNGVKNTGSRTVSISVAGDGTDYDNGTSASISIVDDVDTSPIVVDQSTFQLTGSSGPVNVSLTVTYTAPTNSTAPGTYTWAYQVQNPSSPTGTTTWTTFSLPVENGAAGIDDVQNLQGPSGWTGTVDGNANTISWSTTSGGLAPGDTATFSFTTDPRDISSDTVEVTDGGMASASATADKPGPKDVAPMANLNFYTGRNQGTVTLSITTASGQRYTTEAIPVDTNGPADARDQVWRYLDSAGWKVAKNGGDSGTSLTILGVVKEDGSVDGLKSASLTVGGYTVIPSMGGANPPHLTKQGGVQ